MADFFTADLHCSHRNILKYCNRPFSSIEEMNETITNNINKKVKENDRLFIIGDFCFGSIENYEKYRNQIKCKKVFLIRGNHDLEKDKISHIFTSVDDLIKINSNNTIVVLCHYAMMEWERKRKGAIHLHGHSHGNRSMDIYNSIDVGVDCHDFQPLSFKEVIKQININNEKIENAKIQR